jgi:hypothetical protein
MSITDTRKQRKAARRVQQALRKNPYDIDALLQQAVILGTCEKPALDQKRKVLRRILSLEPGNRTARRMLLEMDRAEIGGDASRLSLAMILTDSSADFAEPPLLLRYSIVHQLLVYLFIAATVFIGLSSARQAEDFVIIGALLLFLLIPLWFVSAVIEISNTGLNVCRLFGIVRSEIPWREIRDCKPTAWGKGIRIITRTGKTVEVSAQVNGYPFILEILQQMRPDLLQVTEVSETRKMAQKRAVVTAEVAQAADKL